MRKLLLSMLIPLLLCGILPISGCREENRAQAACTRFLNYIAQGEYDMAYSLLHSGVIYEDAEQKKDEEEGKTPPQKRITQSQFCERYKNIFEALHITGFQYSALSPRAEGDVICVYDFSLQYETELFDPEPMQLRASMLIEDGAWRIEWSPSMIFPEMDWGDTVRIGRIGARRGEILADGVAYAKTTDAISICAVPALIEDKAQFARQLSLLTDMTAESILKKLESKNALVVIKQLYPDEYSEELEARLLSLPSGISIDKGGIGGVLRDYPQKSALAHLVGYTGSATEEELETLTGSKEGDARYNSDSKVGKTGLERNFEEILRGQDGYYIYISAASGENKKTIYRQPAQDGLDLGLTIDPEVQEKAEVLLRYSIYGEDTSGAVIVMNPKTGRVEAMASYPTFDLNLFARGISGTDYQKLSNQANKPLLNRLTQGRYAPGSIFKPFTAAAALSTGAMTTETKFPYSKEKIEENKWRPSDDGEFGPWRYAVITRVDVKTRQEPMNMHNGMIYSDNIYFAYAALKTGIQAFRDYIEPLGFTEAIPFDIPVQKAQMAGEGKEWDPMLLADSAYGQGEILITPLQAAAIFSAFANDGTIMQPYVVDGLYRVVGPHYECVEKKEPVVWKQNAIEKRIVDTLVPMLEDVSVTGTGNFLGLKRKMSIAGKTGTAQISNNRELAWYVGFRSQSDNPRLVLVMLELPANTKVFNQAKFDIARELLTE